MKPSKPKKCELCFTYTVNEKARSIDDNTGAAVVIFECNCGRTCVKEYLTDENGSCYMED